MDRLGVAGCFGVMLLVGCSSGAGRAREMGCLSHKNPRTVQICTAIAEEMEFKVMGHAVPAPGYKVTAEGLVRVYCRLGLTKNDEAALKQLRTGGTASEHLLQLIGSVWVDQNNIFSAENPSYVLKDGCPAR